MKRELTPEQKIIRYQVCATCGERLSEYYDMVKKEHFIACRRDSAHRTFAREHHEFTPNIETWKEKNKEMAETAVAKYYGNTSLTTNEASETIRAIWPTAEQASPVEVKKAIMLCVQYGLNPLMKHLFLLPYWNSEKKRYDYTCVQGITSNRLIASRKHTWSFLDDTPRIGTEEEEKKHYRTVDPDRIRAIAKMRDLKTGAEVTAWGEWPMWKLDKQGNRVPNEPKGVDKGNSMVNMACIHAERKGIDMLYPADMPDLGVPVVDEKYETMPEVTVEQEPPIEVDRETGEIMERSGESEANKQASTPSSGPTPKTEPKNEAGTVAIKNRGELFQACKDQFNLMPSHVAQEAGYKNPQDIPDKDAANVYQQIKAMRG